ncbi:MAG: ketoacyl-ACP synthase III [Candidatus Tectomicrobia bacterium]|uniref:Beta-ketoacyl-[acyl-carrier-protein] synthase III n=1 Tax=Tectimicrobiota bacterium TaxID=2528274 RepID=A0A932CRQ0_UNCTE|nr:ketoacyl-ACP synthase III [Candidatus Tectomicrobia bacterium]
MRATKIIGVGSYAPATVLTNQDLERMVETSDEWIVARTGIKERRVAAPGEVTSDLATQASLRALEEAGVGAEELDLLIVGTISPDMLLPSTACAVQAKLGAKNAAAFDIAAACSGFLYGLAVAHGFIQSRCYNTILVIGVEIMTRTLDWTDRTTCVLFGDGGGAAVVRGVETTEKEGVLSVHLHSDGNSMQYLYRPGGGSLYPATQETVAQRLHYVKMDGPETFKGAVRAMSEAAREALLFHDCRPEDLALLIPHQANKRIIDAVTDRLKLPKEKVFINVERYGNTSAGSIPLALDEALRGGRIQRGDRILLTTFGAGFTWASTMIRW